MLKSSGDHDEEIAASLSPTVTVKKVNSQVNIDEKTGKVSSSTSNECDLATNIDVNEKMITQKMIKLQASSSLPDLQAGSTSSPSSTATISSNSNNQIQSRGKHVILAVEAQDEDRMNQIDDAACHGEQSAQTKMNFNIDPNGSSSSASSNNLEYGGIAPNPSTL